MNNDENGTALAALSQWGFHEAYAVTTFEAKRKTQK